MKRPKRLALQTLLTGLPGLDALDVDVLVLTYLKDQRPLKGAIGYCDWRLNGRISRMLMSGMLLGRAKEVLLTDSEKRIGTERILVFGLGRKKNMDLGWFKFCIQEILEVVKLAGFRSLALELPGLDSGTLDIPKAMTVFVDGWASICPEAKITVMCLEQAMAEEVARIATKDDRVTVEKLASESLCLQPASV